MIEIMKNIIQVGELTRDKQGIQVSKKWAGLGKSASS